jgi:tetratricopeptide (TPR) repeat protein
MEKIAAKSWVWCCFIALFTWLIWGQTVQFGFVWDDLFLVQDNQSIRSLKNVPSILSSLRAQSSEIAPSFRPLRTAFYALLYAVDGQPAPQPRIFHLASVLWHCGAAMLLFCVALLLLQGLAGKAGFATRMTALGIALGFAANPVVSEAVCWVKCLDDLMAAVFVFASLWCLLKWRGEARWYAAGLVFYFLAALSKESAVPFAMAACLVFAGYHKLPWRRSAVLTVPFLLAAAIYVVWRHLVIGQSAQCPPLSGSYGQTMIDMLPVAPEYLRLLFGIPPFTIDYSFMLKEPPHHVLSGAVLGGLLLLLAWGAVALWLWRREQFRLASFGFIWIGLFLLPVSNLVPMMQYMAERFLYLPLAGLMLALGALFLKVPWRPLSAAVAGLLILAWADCSRARLGIWQDEIKLFVQSSLDNPACARLHENAVISIFNLPHMRYFFGLDSVTKKLDFVDHPVAGNPEAMLHTLTQAHNLFPSDHRVTMALGITCSLAGDPDRAIPLLELATRQPTVRQGTNDPDCWVELGAAYAAKTNRASAKQAYETALRLDAANVPALRRYARLCCDLREYKLALPALQTLQKLEQANAADARLLREVQAGLGPQDQGL